MKKEEKYGRGKREGGGGGGNREKRVVGRNEEEKEEGRGMNKKIRTRGMRRRRGKEVVVVEDDMEKESEKDVEVLMITIGEMKEEGNIGQDKEGRSRRKMEGKYVKKRKRKMRVKTRELTWTEE